MLGRQQGAGKVLALTAEVAARAGAEPHARVYACACARMFAELTVSVGGGRGGQHSNKQTNTTHRRMGQRFSDLPSDPAILLQGFMPRAESGASGGTSTEDVHCTAVYISENAGNQKRLVK